MRPSRIDSTLGLSLALLMATPAPGAHAAADHADLQHLAVQQEGLSAEPVADPGFASTLSLLVPVGFAVATAPIAGPLSVIAAPLGAGAGHFYAGDPLRGTLITLGGLVVPSLGIGLGVGAGSLHASLDPRNASLGSIATLGIVGGLISAIGYTVFAARDAQTTAERRKLP